MAKTEEKKRRRERMDELQLRSRNQTDILLKTVNNQNSPIVVCAFANVSVRLRVCPALLYAVRMYVYACCVQFALLFKIGANSHSTRADILKNIYRCMANVKHMQAGVIVYNWMQMVQCVKHLNCVCCVVL